MADEQYDSEAAIEEAVRFVTEAAADGVVIVFEDEEGAFEEIAFESDEEARVAFEEGARSLALIPFAHDMDAAFPYYGQYPWAMNTGATNAYVQALRDEADARMLAQIAESLDRR